MGSFNQNWKHILEIDVDGHKNIAEHEKANWAALLEGVTQITPAAAETADSTPYWVGKGTLSEDITGKALSFQVAGHRMDGDAAQDYVASKFLVFGDELKTLGRWTNLETGEVVVFVATLKAIVPFGGAANVKQTFSFTLAVDGEPKKLPKKVNVSEPAKLEAKASK